MTWICENTKKPVPSDSTHDPHFNSIYFLETASAYLKENLLRLECFKVNYISCYTVPAALLTIYHVLVLLLN